MITLTEILATPENWQQGSYSNWGISSPDSTCFCLAGAGRRYAAYNDVGATEVTDTIAKSIETVDPFSRGIVMLPVQTEGDIIVWNDKVGRTFEHIQAVSSVFDALRKLV